MARCALRVLSFLFIGAALTVGTAWVFAFRKLPDDDLGACYPDPPTSNGRNLTVRRGVAIGTDYVSSWKTGLLYEHRQGLAHGAPPPTSFAGTVFDLVPSWSRRLVYGSRTQIVWPSRDEEEVWRQVYGHGWPFLALAAWREYASFDDRRSGRERSRGIPLPRVRGPYGDEVLLPILPLWPGFMLDTLFYGTLVFLLRFGPGVLRQRVRRRHGRCVGCGYDLGGSAGCLCPECGRAVVRRAEETCGFLCNSFPSVHPPPAPSGSRAASCAALLKAEACDARLPTSKDTALRPPPK